MSNRINLLIKAKNGRSWLNFVDYTIEELMNHLESKFKQGMNWQNHGSVWHIDHIKPISLFKFSSPEDPDFKECWSLSNLQPLFKEENLSKGNRFIG